jgi:hypothetical protein
MRCLIDARKLADGGDMRGVAGMAVPLRGTAIAGLAVLLAGGSAVLASAASAQLNIMPEIDITQLTVGAPDQLGLISEHLGGGSGAAAVTAFVNMPYRLQQRDGSKAQSPAGDLLCRATFAVDDPDSAHGVMTTTLTLGPGVTPLNVVVQDASPSVGFQPGNRDQVAAEVSCADPTTGETVGFATAIVTLTAG